MKTATIRSTCECQAALRADLDENRHVISGWARDRRTGTDELAPAHSIGASAERFDVAWHCPFCIRNTLRSFVASGLAWRDVPDPAPPAEPSPPAG